MRLIQQSIVPKVGMFAICAIGCLSLLGCNKSGEAKSNGQIVARIGDQVVTAQELDTELRWNNVAADRQRDDVVVKRVLGELVARKYALRHALDAKLDREPNVLLDILRSREQVLANAFAMRELSKQASAITAADTEKYIVDHPLKFANRKILTIEQISFPIGPTNQSLPDVLKEFSALDKIQQRLAELGIASSRSRTSISTSDMPDELLRTIQEKQPGDVIFVRSGQNGVFLSVYGAEVRPLEGEAAMNVARQFQQKDLAKAQASLINFSANMEAKYEGEYAKIMSENPTAPSITN
jgi:EpsD family peptidyl-prolyl cis-trans isomerase